MTRAPAVAAAALLAVAGCIPEEGPMMDPGKDCMECHAPGGEGEPAWTVAGTYPGHEGARVTVTDRNGWTITLRANRAGNFYTAEPLALPLQAIRVDDKGMGAAELAAAAATRNKGSCNQSSCHAGGANF